MGQRAAKALGVLPLTADAYETAAAEAARLSDFGHPYYREGLQVLLASLGEARLSVVGSLMLQRSVFLALQRRLYLTDLRRSDPQFFAQPLTPPLIVTGLPRSGTTFFHRLLAQDPSFHAPSLHELLQPLPLADRTGRRLGRLRLAIELGVVRRMTPGLDARHFTRAAEPEECMFAMCQSFQSLMFWSLAPVYGHVAWYQRQNRRRKYIEHLGLLQVLQSFEPERRLLLKAPEHLGALGEIADIIPQAMIVVCRRDPGAAVTSFNSLIHASHRATSEAPDPRRLARTNLDILTGEARRHAKAREAHRGRCADIDFDLITREPLEAAASVYRHFGLDLAPETTARFRLFAEVNPRSRHGAHRYRAAPFGLDPAAISARFTGYETRRL